jgi:hypothetical protein
VKYADNLMLLSRAETLLKGMIDRLIGNGRYNGVKMNVEKLRSGESQGSHPQYLL